MSTGVDKLYPTDCGRDKDKGTGLLCFPDGELCKNSKNNGEASKMPCDSGMARCFEGVARYFERLSYWPGI